jgi:hypothetical protein
MNPRGPTNGSNDADLDRWTKARLQVRHMSEADLACWEQIFREERKQRRREAADMRADNPRAYIWRPCPICGSTACVSEECREEERRRSRWRHVAEDATTGNGGGRP